MATNSEAYALAAERLSALMDGELDGSTTAQACTQWRDDAQARSSWHAYHLIGDVLRSEDLACDPARDAGFLEAFRTRMAGEPVVLAPHALVSPATALPAASAGATRRRWMWLAPPAVAAGFVAVAGVLMLARAPGTPTERPAEPSLAQAALETPTPQVVAATPAAEPQTFVASGQLIRDARLDRYLAAHKQFAGSSALGVPSAFMRNATADAADR